MCTAPRVRLSAIRDGVRRKNGVTLELAHSRWAHFPGEETRVERRKRYSRKFHRLAVERMRTCESVGELAKELGVTQRCLYKRRSKLETVEAGEEAPRPATHAKAHRKEILQLRRLLAEKAMEVDFLEGGLQKVEARHLRSTGSGKTASTTRSEN